MMNVHRKHNNANVFFITFLSFPILVFFFLVSSFFFRNIFGKDTTFYRAEHTARVFL